MKTTTSKISRWLYVKFIYEDNWAILLKRLIYIVCFIGLCLIDQIIGTAPGNIQFGYKNYTGIIIAIICLTAYRLKDFLKIPYLLWVIVFFICRNLALDWGKLNVSNYIEFQTNLWGIGIYGIILIRFFYYFIIEKRKPRLNWKSFGVCFVMLITMTVIRSDYSWIKALFGAFLCFYLTDFKEKDLSNLFIGMVEGIILGFFVIQGQAWLYRPYDDLRYLGMYCHSNMNGLFYVCAYCAVLAKWYLWKLKKRNILARIPLVLLAGLVVGTSMFTGSRTTLITIFGITIIFLVFQMVSHKKLGIIECIIDAAAIGLAIVICIIPAYDLIRYVPAYVDDPLYFDLNKLKQPDKKILKGDPIDSEKYIEFDEALAGLFGRYLWFQGKEGSGETTNKFREWLKKLGIIMEVEASGYVEGDEVYVEPGTDSKHPLLRTYDEDFEGYDVRLDIYKYFVNKLTLIGERNNVQGVWINWYYHAAHCHNVFLQIAYDFGIIVGIMFIIIILMLYNKIIFGLIEYKTGPWYYRLFVTASFATAFVVFGQLEIVWTYGQLPFTMFFIVQYLVYHKEPEQFLGLEAEEGEIAELESAHSEEQYSDMEELEIIDLEDE